jgi:hypothetical protein
MGNIRTAGQAILSTAVPDGHMEGMLNAIETEISHDDIARRAYEIWQARGCPPSDGTEDWQTAKAELLASRIRRNGSTQDRMQSWWGRMRRKIARRDT